MRVREREKFLFLGGKYKYHSVHHHHCNFFKKVSIWEVIKCGGKRYKNNTKLEKTYDVIFVVVVYIYKRKKGGLELRRMCR